MLLFSYRRLYHYCKKNTMKYSDNFKSISRIPFTHSGVPDKQPPSDEEGFQLYVTHSCIETLSHSVIKPTATLHHPKLPM